MARVTLIYPDYTVMRLFSSPGTTRVERGGWYAEGVAALAATLKLHCHDLVVMRKVYACLNV